MFNTCCLVSAHTLTETRNGTVVHSTATPPAAYVHGTSSPGLSGGRARFWPSQWPSFAPQPETWPLQCQPSRAQPASDEAVVVLNSYIHTYIHAQGYISTKGLLCVVLHASSPYPSLATQLHNHNCTHP